MDMDYDSKFEEMKKYIPFLESMIKRLETSSTGSANPRQAQLDKIRSLRDLLLDKKKRMKMENLLKCEQVLVNLYAKVEQRDTKLEPIHPAETTKSTDKQDLETVRHKLKSVVKRQEKAETLPEIARASEIEEICTPGSKEPALFQRRPHRYSISPRSSPTLDGRSNQTPNSKRNYTRVLVSPEPGSRPLFSRRSPRRSPKRYSPTYNKKERKKASKQKSKDLNITLNVPEESLNSLNTKDILSRIINCSDGDVDIDTLRELRTQILGELKQTGASDDISDLILKSYKNTMATKIPNKNNKKVEVEEGELSDSESEAIESIYGSLVVVEKDTNKSNQVKKLAEADNQPRKIQICLVINADKDGTDNNSEQKLDQTIDVSDFEMFDDKDKRKDKNISDLPDKEPLHEKNTDEVKTKLITNDGSTCENKNNLFSLDNSTNDTCVNKNNLFSLDNSADEDKNNTFSLEKCTDEEKNEITKQTVVSQDKGTSVFKDTSFIDDDDDSFSSISSSKDKDEIGGSVPTDKIDKDKNKGKRADNTDSNDLLQQMLKRVTEPSQFKANFYQPIVDQGNKEPFKSTAEVKNPPLKPESEIIMTLESQEASKATDASKTTEATKTNEELEGNLGQNVEIPLLHERIGPEQPPKETVVSEIDILQALKNEILSETIAIPGSEPITPALHQPKISKVANAQGILPKKRISIEKYKEKAVSSKPFVLSKEQDMTLPDNTKKQSLKLTEKECERFNFPTKLALDDDDDDDDDLFDNGVEEKCNTVEDIYVDLAPKSPDYVEERNDIATTPVIIPADPVKSTITSSKADIDMRTLLPLLSPNTINMCASSLNIPPLLNESIDAANIEINREANKGVSDKIRSPLVDPRVRRDMNLSIQTNCPNNICEKVPLLPNPIVSFTNVTPNITPNMTPILNPSMTPNRTPILAPSMTPIMTPNARSYEMTPSHQSIEVDNLANRKHVYAPMFPAFDLREPREQSVSKEIHPVWERNDITTDNRKGRRDGRKSKWDDPRNSSVQREAPELPKSRYSDSYKYQKDPRNDRYDRRDNSLTPVPSFGRSEGPSTPMHPFGRSDCPTTPSHPFGRSECPPTPSHVFGRSECPATPSHPFGRSECPTTPSHPFGRSECPPTPSHSFDRSDCPTTPSHPFGRAECPLTPNHPFGRNDMPMAPSHPFGRQEYSQNPTNTKFNKDPRLNRSSDHEANYKYNERDRSFYKERGINSSNSYKSHSRSYRNSDNFGKNDRDHSIGKRDRNSYYSQDQNERHNNRDQMSKREPSVGHNMSKDYEEEIPYYRKRGSGQYNNEHSKSFEEVGTRRGYCRERSVGQNLPSNDNFTRSSSRARSIGRDNPRESEIENTLSVKSHAGRSFTIDTSVNATFQDFIESGKGIQVFDYSFDARKRRSASVGRSLAREPSVVKTLPQASKTRTENDIDYRKNNLRRACSVGRDIVDPKTERSLRDIKADFENFRSSLQLTKTASKKNNIKSKDTYEWNPRTKKDVRETKQNINTCSSNTINAYSPRKNYRDPRMRREQFKDGRNSKDSRDRKNDGIVYSNDNIARGTILGSGYGVKNYKIPKIKRAVEIKEEKEKDVPKKPEISEKTATEKKPEPSVAIEKKVNSKIVKDSDNIDDCIEKRITRSRNSDLSKPTKNINKTRKNKKAIILDSDSETDVDTKDNKISEDSDSSRSFNESKKPNSKIISPTLSPTKQNKTLDSTNLNDLDTSFGMDDLDMFSENIVSDPVIDNINALIADLDNDLNTSKNDTSDKFTKEFNVENMLESIISPKSDNTPDEKDKSLDIPITSIGNTTKNNKPEVSTQSNQPKPVQDSNDTIVEKVPVISLENITKKNTDIDENKSSCDAIVSTTGTEKEGVLKKIEDKLEEFMDAGSNDGCSTPDSTINNDEIAVEKSRQVAGLPDSTNDKQTEMNSDVTSTHETTETATHESSETHTYDVSETLVKDNAEPSSSRKEGAPALESIGSLLSMLQDSSKIKELLSLLGDKSGDNEKIMKKLEKLREIVSDEEDVKDDAINKIEKLGVSNKSEALNIINNELPDTNNVNSLDDKVFIATDEKKCSDKSDTYKEELEENAKKELESKQTDDLKETGIQTVAEIKTDTIHDVDKSQEESALVLDSTQNAEKAKPKAKPTKKPPLKKTKYMKKYKGKNMKKSTTSEPKRVTRAGLVNCNIQKIPVIKKPSRELLKLQEDIKEMFIRDDVLNATGIRMCRLAKLVDEKNTNEGSPQDVEPVVVLEKFKNAECVDQPSLPDKRIKKKPGPKSKAKNIKIIADNESKVGKPTITQKYKPGPKSKTKVMAKSIEEDPYAFETDSIGETSITKASDGGHESSSDYESGSLASSFGSTELLADIKKNKKRKRRGWQAGVIKTKKKKVDTKQSDSLLEDEPLSPQTPINIPDMNCFIDKNYCFRKNVFTYSCRLCMFIGKDIVHHYKKHHPHSEIPLSRMNPPTAKEAIEQCEEINFQAISKIPTDKYVCRFCFKEFGKSKAVLEIFFWHVVSMHTGEYKQTCSECVNVNRCPFDLDIPPPPKDVKGQLIGYICGKCNFTQISLENLKTHVIVRHNDEQTEVYTINLASMTRKAITALTKRCNTNEQPRVLRSLRSNQSVTDISDDRSDITDSSHTSEPDSLLNKSDASTSIPQMIKAPKLKQSKPIPIQSKITFETDDNAETDLASMTNEDRIIESTVKIEPNDSGLNQEETAHFDKNDPEDEASLIHPVPAIPVEIEPDKTNENSDDIVQYPHFKIAFTESGSKEYVCCINGKDNHYKTTLLISMKKHIQMKHTEKWDGYCCICKVIITPQGLHHFKECLQHYLDKHIDNFPVLEKDEETRIKEKTIPDVADAHSYTLPLSIERTASPKTYINVRPIADLIPIEDKEATPRGESPFPKIESVVSLGSSLPAPLVVEPPRASPISITAPKKKIEKEKLFDKYEEAQAEIMSKKHQVVLDTMMSKEKLLQVYKCAGRYCSFTSDSPEEAIIHASTHQRIGGENALCCSYCDYGSSGNAIDLVMHVFKVHGRCQYSCAQCFYRAAASQLVGAHITRIHGEVATAGSVLRTTSISQTVGEDVADMLTREEAVSYYVCKHNDSEGSCKFRTFTSGKFYDHLMQKHGSATAYPCNLCPIMGASPTELVQHMKAHGLRLYQCTWCVYGADNESELLDHTSAVHPTKQPQAYLRIITNKVDGLEMRVLPLAYLNKSKVPTEDVTPSGNKDNPVKEAERSIELEKLIGFTNVLIASSASDLTAEPHIEEDTTIDIPDTEILSNDLSVSTVLEPPPIATSPRLLTPPQASIPNINEQLTPVLKSEPIDKSPVKEPLNDVVYCLDSDDEDSGSNVIDLSDDISKTTTDSSIESMRYKKIPPLVLFKCPGCNGRFRTLNGFKKHFCPLNTSTGIKCPHCQLLTKDKNELTEHYVKDHVDPMNHMCGICNMGFTGLTLAKKHLKDFHKVTYICTLSKTMPNGEIRYIVNESEKSKALQKRKLSEKTKRYSPKDIDKLPINPILDSLVYCSLCEFNTKVRLNMVRHLQQHTEQQPVPQTAPVNPVPHLETNEKHFDKMVNLASSSIVNRTPDKATKHDTPTVTLLIPPEAASRYPKYVPERQRHTCGAKGCSYISVNEAMLRFHWDTLHSGTIDFHCVHCPPYQHLDTSKPLTASRIIAHLKMHDVSLYACSSCSYYHHRRLMVEKHLTEVHKGSQLRVVREETMPTLPAPVPPTSAPTMDLKPWQCGLCQFKSMLRPEVAEHCAKLHQSKMQFKCAYCPFRTSMKENVTKHQLNAHPGKSEDIFYFYYREDSIPDEEDGTPRWMKQRQKSGIPESEVKTEVTDASQPTQPTQPILPSSLQTTQPTSTPAFVDLNLVKKEVVESGAGESIEELCKKFGQFCEPNGINYKCPLCKVVTESTPEAMQSHLYEELKYRKWSCTICSYKAFHKTGLNEHMASEHRRQYQEPLELPIDINIEKWVAKQIEHQNKIIEKNKEIVPKLQMHTHSDNDQNVNKIPNMVVTAVTAGPSRLKQIEKSIQMMATLQPVAAAPNNYRLKELEEALGSVGAPKDMQLCCPKCNLVVNDAFMRDHLESELTKIRWCCSNCSNHFQTYHEAQYHCKSVHPGLSTRPKEATRDPAMRNEWVNAVITEQKRQLKSLTQNTSDNILEPICSPEESLSDSNENSLLVVRYEERVQTPEGAALTRKRSLSPDSDDAELVIDSSDEVPQKKLSKTCPYCPYINPNGFCMKAHILKHYDLRPYKCPYCVFYGYTQAVERHLEMKHKGSPKRILSVPLPDYPPTNLEVSVQKKRPLIEEEVNNVLCLTCEKYISDSAKATHLHENLTPEFAKKGSVVVKCCVCLMLRFDMKSLQAHHKESHINIPINYAFVKVQADLKEVHHCGHCTKHFKYLRDLVAHHNVVHNYLSLKYTTGPYSAPSSSSPIVVDTVSLKRKSSDASTMPLPKRIAKKSTSKLPIFKTVAKKSTTKLPDTLDSDSDSEQEYTYYGTSPTTPDNYANVTTLMPFFNNMVPFTFQKLSEIIKIDPKVVVKDIKM